MRQSVALYFHRLSGLGGGAERIICTLATALSVRGLEVHLVTLDEADAVTFYPLGSEVTWHRLGFAKGITDKVRRTVALLRVLRIHGIGVLIGFVMSGDKTVYAAARLACVKIIAAERNGPSMYMYRCSRLQRWIAFTMLYLADCICVQFREFGRAYPSGLQSRIVSIPNPVLPATRLARPGKADAGGRFTLLSVGRCDNFQKRLDCLIRAFSELAIEYPDWDLCVFGDGPDREQLRLLVSHLDLSNRVRFEGAVKNVHDAYTKAHLFVIPSLWEGFPNALAEALSHGLPAVGFREAEGVSNLIQEGVNGWLADGNNNASAFAKTLRKAMADSEMRTKYALAAVESMKQFSPEVQFDHWVEIVKALAPA